VGLYEILLSVAEGAMGQSRTELSLAKEQAFGSWPEVSS
jgi:hypothetical protein